MFYGYGPCLLTFEHLFLYEIYFCTVIEFHCCIDVDCGLIKTRKEPTLYVHHRDTTLFLLLSTRSKTLCFSRSCVFTAFLESSSSHFIEGFDPVRLLLHASHEFVRFTSASLVNRVGTFSRFVSLLIRSTAWS